MEVSSCFCTLAYYSIFYVSNTMETRLYRFACFPEMISKRFSGIEASRWFIAFQTESQRGMQSESVLEALQGPALPVMMS